MYKIIKNGTSHLEIREMPRCNLHYPHPTTFANSDVFNAMYICILAFSEKAVVKFLLSHFGDDKKGFAKSITF